MSFIWFPVFLGWLAKLVVLRAGGLTGYRRAVPFFAGLVLGNYAVGSVWDILGVVFETPTYRFRI